MTFRVGFVTGATPDKWARIWGERSRSGWSWSRSSQDVQLDGVRDGSLSMALVRLPVDRTACTSSRCTTSSRSSS